VQSGDGHCPGWCWNPAVTWLRAPGLLFTPWVLKGYSRWSAHHCPGWRYVGQSARCIVRGKVYRAGRRPSFGESRQSSRLVGKLCESGDVLIQEIPLPQVSRHDLIAIPAAGAYQLSMSSNYNLATRPVVLWLEPGSLEVFQPREYPENSRWWTAEG